MMDLTPLEVRKKKGDFRRQIRGYDPESVDDFLDLVADRLEQLVRGNASLTETSTRLEQQVGDWQEREKALTEALVTAQQMRAEMRTRAQEDADASRTEAQRYAEEERSKAAAEAEAARRAAELTLQRAKEQAARELEQARAEARRELQEARAMARAALEGAKLTAETELDRIREELDRVRGQEQDTIRSLQDRRAKLVESYRDLLERERSGLEGLADVDAAVAEVAAGDPPGLPALSPALLAAIEAAQAEVEVPWDDEAAEDVVAALAALPVEADEPVAVDPEPAEREATVVDAAAPARGVPASVTETDAATDPSPADPQEQATVAASAAVEPASGHAKGEASAASESPKTPAVPAWEVRDDGTAEASAEASDEKLIEDATTVVDDVEADLVLEEAADLVLEDGDLDDDSWLSNLVAENDGGTPPPAPAPAADVEEAAIEAAARATTDEDFIDTLIAQAGVAPSQKNGNNASPAPSRSPAPAPATASTSADPRESLGDLLRSELDDDGADESALEEIALELDEIDPTEGFDDLDVAAVGAVAESGSDPADTDAREGTPAAQDVEPGGMPKDPVAQKSDDDTEPAGTDEDEGFDALFEDGGDVPASFDFDAALANATGVTGRPDGSKRKETAFDLGVEFDDASPLDLGRGGAGAFGVEDLGRPAPAGRGLTLRPLSPEEEAPDLPVEPRRKEENDDDMFSTMFGGR